MINPLRRNEPSFTDSPWFWVCLFSAGGVMALVLGASRISFRQAQIEREYRARQLSGAAVLADDVEQPLPQASRTRITIRPLVMALGGIVVIAWSILWWQRKKVRDSSGPDRGSATETAGQNRRT